MKAPRQAQIPIPDIDSLIVTLRGQKVILDAELARLYGVPTYRFNEAVKRNEHRFPLDFRFQLTREEWKKGAMPKTQDTASMDIAHLISQTAISSSGYGGRRKQPYAFTEHGGQCAQ
jgi:hypothetical protein